MYREKGVRQKQIIEDIRREERDLKSEKRREAIILLLAFVSIIGFAFSLFFLVGITGAAIGNTRANLYGLVIIIVSLLIWAIAEVIWIRGRREKEIDVKELLKDLEKEGFPMLYRRYKV